LHRSSTATANAATAAAAITGSYLGDTPKHCRLLTYPPPRQSIHTIRYQSTTCPNEKQLKYTPTKNASMSHLTTSSHTTDKDIQMQELALSIQLLQDQKRYKEFLTSSDYPTKNDKLLSDSKMVVEYYANAKASLPLGSTTMSGPELCHSLISNVILPHCAQGERVTLTHEQLECILDLCFLTVQSLGKLCIKHNRQRGWNKGSDEGILRLGDLAEQLLRQLLNTPFCIGTGIENGRSSTGNHKVKGRMIAKVTRLYNNTLNTWSCIASTTLNTTMAKDAAFRAERLLLDLATSRSRGALVGGDGGDSVDKKHHDRMILLEYLKPDVVSFNTTINAWSKSGRFKKNIHGGKVDVTTISAAERAEAILRLLQDLYDESRKFDNHFHADDAILPDILSYEAVIYAWSRALDCPQAPIRATRILEDMVERYYRAHDKEKDVKMMLMHQNRHHRPPFPSRQTFSSVLTTWGRSSTTDFAGTTSDSSCLEAIEQAEKLFCQMKKLGQDGYEQNNPDTISYNALLQVYANQIEYLLQRNAIPSSIREAVGLFKRMVNILEEMKAVIPTHNGVHITKVDANPDSTTYKILLQSIIHISLKVLRLKKNEPCDVSVDDCSQFALSFLRQLQHFPTQQILIDQSIKDLFTLLAISKNLEGIKTALTLLATSQLGLSGHEQITVDHLEGLLEIICRSAEQKGMPATEIVPEMEKYMLHELQKNFGMQPTTRLWNALIDAYSKLASSHIKYAHDADRIMMHVLHKYKVALENISDKRGDSEHLLVARPNTFTFHSVITAYAEACNIIKLPYKSRMKAVERMEEILSMMDDMNEQKQKLKSWGDIQEAKYVAHVTPNSKTYNVLLSTFDNCIKYTEDMHDASHIFGKAEQLVEKMSTNVNARRNTTAKPDNYTYATLLSILAKTKLPDATCKAREILNTALEARLDNFDTIILNNTMNVLSSRGNCSSDVLEMFQQLESESLKSKSGKIKPDKFTFSIVMSSLANEGTIEAANSVETLYHRMLNYFKAEKDRREARKIQPDIYCYNAIIKAWSNIHTCESLLRAESHLDRLIATRSSVEPDGSSFSVVIHGHSKRLESNAAADCERVLDKKEQYQRRNRKIPINIGDYRTTIQKYKQELNPQGCLQILERLLGIMKEDKSSRFVNTHQLTSLFNTVMESFFESSTENAYSTIQDIFDLMNVQGLAKPDSISYSILMKSYANNRSPDSLKAVNEILQKFLTEPNLSKTIRPEQNAVLCNILFEACELSSPCTNSNPVTIAFDRFNSMTSSDSKVHPSHTTYKHMFAICKNHVQNELKRNDLLKVLFRKCCADGQLSEEAFSVFKDAMPIHHFDEVVSSMVGRKVNERKSVQIMDFPRSCRLNVSAP